MATAFSVVQKELEIRKNSLVDALATGAAIDFADYKRIVGEIRGLSLADELLKDKRLPESMEKSINEILWNQFGASIDMLINVISNCPDDYFTTHKRFYYLAFHSTIFLDYYLTIPPSDFSPFLSFTQKETEDRPIEAIDDLIPDKFYEKREIVAYHIQII